MKSSQVPYLSLNKSHPVYTPDTARPVSRFPPHSSRSRLQTPVLMSFDSFRCLIGQFAFASLSGSYMLRYIPQLLTVTFTTAAFRTEAAYGCLKPFLPTGFEGPPFISSTASCLLGTFSAQTISGTSSARSRLPKRLRIGRSRVYKRSSSRSVPKSSVTAATLRSRWRRSRFRANCSLRSCRNSLLCDRRRWQRRHEHARRPRPAGKTTGEVRPYEHTAKLFAAQQADARLTSCRTGGLACRSRRKLPESFGFDSNKSVI